jgi:hypothetical protein
MDDPAFEQAALARAAGPVLAAVGQADALADRRAEDRLVAVDAEAPAARLQGDGERHGLERRVEAGSAEAPRGVPRARDPGGS